MSKHRAVDLISHITQTDMPTKRKKYDARFSPSRIKRIMQSDEEVGKIGSSVPFIMSKALEMFLESLLKEASEVTKSRNARTLTTSHLKIAINSNDRFTLLRELVSTLSDTQQEHSSDGEPTGPV